MIMGGGGGRRRLSGDDGDVNILLLVGAVGAGVSLLLLVIGLCRARWVHRATAGNVGGEVEERRRKKTTTTTKCTNKDVATFEPGKNNPGSRHGWFRRPSGINGNKTAASGSPLRPPPPPAFPPTNINSRPNTPDQYHTDDDESNADFVLARAALLRNDNDGNDANNDGGGESLEDGDVESLGGESFGYTVDGESSLAASRNAAKYVAAAAAAIPGTTTNEDSAIGAGGISSFTNDRGIFRWNENGTKMVYTPTTATLRKTGGGVVVGVEQNGFIFDERKKKWVVKEKIVGGKTSKNVSFPSSTALTASTESEHIIKRVRSNESTAGGSVISGMTGMSEFTYDHVGRSNNTTTTTTTTATNDNGRKVITTKKKKAASPNTPDETEEGFEISSSMGITLTPLTPATVYDDTNDNDTIDDIDQLLLRVGPTTLSTPTRNEHSNNNNNDDLDDDDGSTSMMTGFTDIYESNTALSGLTNIVTPDRNGGDGNRYTANNDDDCGSSVRTGDPGRIIPKTRKKFDPRPPQQQQSQQPSSSDGGGAGGGMFFGAGRLRSVITAAPPSMLKISEDTPFDEDIPFDERSKINNNNDNDGQLLHHRPELKDDDDDEYEDDESQGSANSEHVLKDLDSLSKFMYERKRSEKKKRGRVVGGGARGSGGWDDSRTSSARFGGAGRTITSSSTAGRKSSFGSRGI